MRILLDNCVDRNAKALFHGHEVEHVLDRGWGALSNGRLLAAAAEAGFQAFVTVDKNLRYQQNIVTVPIRVVELNVLNNRIESLRRCTPHLPLVLHECARFNFVSVSPDGRIETAGPRGLGSAREAAQTTPRAIARLSEPFRELERPRADPAHDRDRDPDR